MHWIKVKKRELHTLELGDFDPHVDALVRSGVRAMDVSGDDLYSSLLSETSSSSSCFVSGIEQAVCRGFLGAMGVIM